MNGIKLTIVNKGAKHPESVKVQPKKEEPTPQQMLEDFKRYINNHNYRKAMERCFSIIHSNDDRIIFQALPELDKLNGGEGFNEVITICEQIDDRIEGDAAASYILGRWELIDENYKEARTYLEKAHNKELALATRDLGMLYHFGQGVDKNAEMAHRYYKQAVELGFVNALEWDATLYADEQNMGPALDLMGQAADTGNSVAMKALGDWHAFGVNGVKVDVDEAHRHYARAAEHGNVDALVADAKLYYKSGDKTKAGELTLRAAKMGDVDAIARLADFYLRGECGFVKNDAIALDNFRKAAAKCHAGANNSILCMCLDGSAFRAKPLFSLTFSEMVLREVNAPNYETVKVRFSGDAFSYGMALKNQGDMHGALNYLKKAADYGHLGAPVEIYKHYKDVYERNDNDQQAVNEMLTLASNERVITADPEFLYFFVKNQAEKLNPLAINLLLEIAKKAFNAMRRNTFSDKAEQPSNKRTRY